MKLVLVAAAVVMAMTAPAFAKHCPKDAAIIDKAMSTVKGLTKAQMTQAKDMRDSGMALHKSGKHGESIRVLHAATKILGVAPYKPM